MRLEMETERRVIGGKDYQVLMRLTHFGHFHVLMRSASLGLT